MQRGKRKSPFVGSTEADNNILYFRYTNLSDILLDGSIPPPAEAAGEGVPAKKKPKREKVKKPKPEAEANGAAAQKQPKQKKAKGPRKLAPEERVSGPGNASEALHMREALGFVASTPEEIAEAQAAGERAARPSTFSFGFAVAGGPGAAAPTAAAVKPAAPAAAPAAAQPSGSSSESSDSESDSESEQPEQQPAAVAAAAGGETSSSDDSSSESEGEEEEEAIAAANGGGSGSESSSDEEESSSESEDEEEGAAAPQAVAPAQRAPAAAQPAPRPAPAAPVQQPQQATPQQGVEDEDEDGEYVPRRVYVGGMPFSYTEDKVHEYWSYCGEIEGMDCMTFPDTGRFRGIAFITFTTQEGYDAALGCDGEQCDGQTLKVQKCKWSPKERAARARQRAQQAQQAPAPAAPQQQAQPHSAPLQQRAQVQQQQPQPVAARPQYASPAPKTEGYNVAYVGNVAFEADAAELERLFEGYGVTLVRLHTDKDTGRSKGFAHIHFKDAESLDRAMALNGTSLHGRKIKMGYAQPKKQ